MSSKKDIKDKEKEILNKISEFDYKFLDEDYRVGLLVDLISIRDIVMSYSIIDDINKEGINYKPIKYTGEYVELISSYNRLRKDIVNKLELISNKYKNNFLSRVKHGKVEGIPYFPGKMKILDIKSYGTRYCEHINNLVNNDNLEELLILNKLIDEDSSNKMLMVSYFRLIIYTFRSLIKKFDRLDIVSNKYYESNYKYLNYSRLFSKEIIERENKIGNIINSSIELIYHFLNYLTSVKNNKEILDYLNSQIGKEERKILKRDILFFKKWRPEGEAINEYNCIKINYHAYSFFGGDKIDDLLHTYRNLLMFIIGDNQNE